ncbi:preprotein translocase subunit SecB [Ornithobacterium rhinotracheale]|uniref:protein-export chaperone SecB n=1 Tax=Ornithobacterium rhinotracheale TaxID=28251 RepID=UPI00129C7906|nr:protein-export chaperone SecB [Ornithobacterium rhinotracheale]MRJ09339.1 preprotein translocase subunit SecB [Ornithobacterium rhinotracheale]UOH77027.1 protein-export chaperone SecB [Ornithobacterium rhinotracheale]
MKIQLQDWKVSRIDFRVFDKILDSKGEQFELEVGNYFSKDIDENIFGVKFKLSIEDELLNLNIEALFNFCVIDEDITEEFKLSSFPKINAPAIAFPYLRAFISNLTLQSGFPPIILPSINFVKMAEDNINGND